MFDIRDKNWYNRANCIGVPLEVFYPPEDEQGREIWSDARKRDFKAVCRNCPVRRDCLHAGLNELGDYWVDFGGRGGMTANEREVYAKAAPKSDD